jgi:hypothetical protein
LKYCNKHSANPPAREEGYHYVAKCDVSWQWKEVKVGKANGDFWHRYVNRE